MEEQRTSFDEFSFIDWVRTRLPSAEDAGVLIGPGDDCALVRSAEDTLLLKVDSVLQGEHFQLDDPSAPGFATPQQVGYKVMARTISDIAAMGGAPKSALIATALPRGSGAALREGLVAGLLSAAEPWGVALIGGDTKSWSGPLCLSVSLTGEMGGRTPVLRSGARVGDLLFVSGELGGSILGRHLSFQPRVVEGQWLAGFGATSMIDLSDGLSGDLWQICKASGVSAVIEADRVPVSEAARMLAERDGASALDHALHDGEDFELLFSVPADRADALESSWPYQTKLTRIGEIRAHSSQERKLGEGLLLRDAQGEKPLLIKGYEHKL